MSEEQQRQELRETFRQIVLTLGGILSVYEADDDLVWAIAHGLDQIFEAKLTPITDDGDPAQTSEPRRRPHPAVVELLASIDRLHPQDDDQPARTRGHNSRTC